MQMRVFAPDTIGAADVDLRLHTLPRDCESEVLTHPVLYILLYILTIHTYPHHHHHHTHTHTHTHTHMKPVVIETMWQGKAAGRVLLSFSRRPLFQALFPGAAEAAQSQQQSQQQQQQRSSTTLVSLLVA